MKKFNEIIPRGLVVSCQAREGEPLFGGELMARMAKCAFLGGAVGIRANSPPDIRAIRQNVNLPIIGIYKIKTPGFDVYITPDFKAAEKIAQAGADVIALDATARNRSGGETLEYLIKRIRDKLELPVMADCSTLEEGIQAQKLGADAVATTLAGYTSYSKSTPGPDLELIKLLAQNLSVPVVGEGRYFDPKDVASALNCGAHCVVVGTAITRPQDITARFANAIKNDIS